MTYKGVIGTVIGDIAGSSHESKPVKVKRFKLLNKKSRITDDTVLTMAVIGLSSRLSVFSFYITEEQLAELPIKFISGSKERSLEIFKLIRDKDEETVREFYRNNI